MRLVALFAEFHFFFCSCSCGASLNRRRSLSPINLVNQARGRQKEKFSSESCAVPVKLTRLAQIRYCCATADTLTAQVHSPTLQSADADCSLNVGVSFISSPCEELTAPTVPKITLTRSSIQVSIQYLSKNFFFSPPPPPSPVFF